jgi:hypothetical protein
MGKVVENGGEKVKEAVRGVLPAWHHFAGIICGRTHTYVEARDLKGKMVTVELDMELTDEGLKCKPKRLIKGWSVEWRKGKRMSYQWKESGVYVQNRIYVEDRLVNTLRMPAFSKVLVEVREDNGRLQTRITVPSTGPKEVEKLLPIVGGLLMMDERMHFYLIGTAEAVFNRRIEGKLFVTGPNGVLEYDGKGGFIGLRAVFWSGPMPSINWVKIDPAGNIYWLDFKADHLDVMMAPVPKE